MNHIPVRMYKKGDSKPLNDTLTLFSHEIACTCFWKDCMSVVITERTLESFNKTRSEYGKKIFITSGNRCRRKNTLTANSSPNSNHMYGDALDMTTIGEGDFDELMRIAKKHFKYVYRIPGTDVIHCDNRFNKE